MPKASVRSIKSLLASGHDDTTDMYQVRMARYMAATATVLVHHASRAMSSAARPAKTFDCSMQPRVACSDVVFSRRSAGRSIGRAGGTKHWKQFSHKLGETHKNTRGPELAR